MKKKLSGFLGFSGSPGSRTFFENPRDRDPEHLCKNPRDFYIPGIGIFFRGMGNPDKKPPLGVRRKITREYLRWSGSNISGSHALLNLRKTRLISRQTR